MGTFEVIDDEIDPQDERHAASSAAPASETKPLRTGLLQALAELDKERATAPTEERKDANQQVHLRMLLEWFGLYSSVDLHSSVGGSGCASVREGGSRRDPH